ncbi:MAG: Lysylphosphatidylglycerol synthetase/glycosyltransferase AglD [Gemmatimonadetes bacterium]|nr:Lysylphosphatidylglycerol synthetase/glycosyltransferase AglD [Gemmatimonadota bacterium]
MKLGWRSALGILLSAVFLYLAFKGINFGEVMANVRKAHLGLLALSAVAATFIFPLRARRWRPILDPIAPNLSFGILWPPVAIGMMINNVAPARAGEPARAFALSRSTPKVPFPAAFASLVVDRLFDMVVLLLLMFGAMFDPAFPVGAKVFGVTMASLAIKGIAFVVIIIGVMYAMVLFPERILALYDAFARGFGAFTQKLFGWRVSTSVESRGRSALESLTHGMSVLRTPSRFAEVFGWTLLHWLLNAFAFWLAFRAVGITAPYSAALFLQGVIAVGVAAPQAPGFFGIFELCGKEGLSLYGVDAGTAVTWAIGFHFLSYIPITVIGSYYFLRAGLSMDQIEHAGDTTEPAAANR